VVFEDDTVKEALDKIRAMAESFRLELREAYRLEGRDAFYLKFAEGAKDVDLTLTGPALLQIQSDADSQAQLSAYLRVLQRRFQNASPNYFMCKSGMPIGIEFQWPIARVHGQSGGLRAAVSLLALATNLREADAVTKCPLVMTHLQHEQTPALSIPMAFTNRFRNSMDLSAVTFYPREALPSEFPWIEPQPEPQPALPDEIREFLRAKVYWLAFKQGGKNTKVWIADPWDAAYLKTEVRILLQTAEILEAEGFMEVDDEFARPSGELLRKSAEFEGGPPPKAIRREQKTWDLFVSHASEDKKAFVRPLVERLRLEGLTVWYDELTLTLGDSLRQKIDEGLAASRYGVVVLSKAFFAKDWPRKELDGLDALEVDGRKVILPIWHEVSQPGVARFSPILAGRLAARSSDGMDTVVRKILEVVRPRTDPAPPRPAGAPPGGASPSEWRDPEEYWNQRKQLPIDTPAFKAILSRPRWQVWIRPSEFKKARFRNAEHCKQFMRSSYVRVNSVMKSFPRFQEDRLEMQEEWIAGEAEESGTVGHIERWNLFRSGQFVHHAALNEIAQMGKRVHVLEILDTVGGAFTFAARMAREGALHPSAAVTVELFSVAGRELSWPQSVAPEEDRVPGRCWCQDDHIAVTKVVSTEELESRHREIALDVTIEILAKFGWADAPRQPLTGVADGRFEV